jgi:DASS family divalent anion:Na+ symporter
MSAMALVGIAAILATRTLTITEALSGFGNTSAWLVVAAFFIAAGFTKTGLGFRMAYGLVSLFGQSTLAVGYSLVATDLVLAPAIASNTARAGGVVFPILQSIAKTAIASDESAGRKTAAFLTLTAYQGTVVTSAMFLTAMVANPLVVQLAANQGVRITWTMWALAAAVPGLVSLVVVPLIVYRICPPGVARTPEAPALARAALKALGPMSRAEWMMAITSAVLLVAWATGPWLGLDPTAAALIAIAALLVTGILSWDELLREREAWNTFVWFGALVMMANFLGQLGLVTWFSGQVGQRFEGIGWIPGFLGLSLTYFYTHYFFASNTAHASAMYAPFLALAIALGTPPLPAALILAFFTNLCACTTHYGTPPGPILFGSGYVRLSTWWTAGAVISVVHIAIWLGIGVVWWRALGLWG